MISLKSWLNQSFRELNLEVVLIYNFFEAEWLQIILLCINNIFNEDFISLFLRQYLFPISIATPISIENKKMNFFNITTIAQDFQIKYNTHLPQNTKQILSNTLISYFRSVSKFIHYIHAIFYLCVLHQAIFLKDIKTNSQIMNTNTSTKLPSFLQIINLNITINSSHFNRASNNSIKEVAMM